MNVYVMSLTRSKQNLKVILDWCYQNFQDIVPVTSPTQADLHKISYDNQVHGIVVWYFRDDIDYTHFLLRWT